MVEIGSKTSRNIIDYKLSRYACYLIVQNSDPRKEVVALGQTYFVIQTRVNKKGNYSLNRTSITSGVKNLDKLDIKVYIMMKQQMILSKGKI